MICSWRWFIHPATAISTNRNGSRTLGISLPNYREPLSPAVTSGCKFKEIEFSDHTGGVLRARKAEENPHRWWRAWKKNDSGARIDCGNPQLTSRMWPVEPVRFPLFATHP